MEVFAGFGEQTDYEVGRLLEAIGEMGQLENTLVLRVRRYRRLRGWRLHGAFSEMTYFNGVNETVPTSCSTLKIWAVRSPTVTMLRDGRSQAILRLSGPSRLRAASVERKRGVIYWPKRVTDKGCIRPQFHT